MRTRIDDTFGRYATSHRPCSFDVEAAARALPELPVRDRPDLSHRTRDLSDAAIVQVVATRKRMAHYADTLGQ